MNIQDIVDFSEATTAPERFRPAPEKVLKGDPEQTIFNHYDSPCGQMNAGVWEGAVGQWTVNYTEHEYCEIVQGVSVLRDNDGNAKTLRAGSTMRRVIVFRSSAHPTTSSARRSISATRMDTGSRSTGTARERCGKDRSPRR